MAKAMKKAELATALAAAIAARDAGEARIKDLEQQVQAAKLAASLAQSGKQPAVDTPYFDKKGTLCAVVGGKRVYWGQEHYSPNVGGLPLMKPSQYGEALEVARALWVQAKLASDPGEVFSFLREKGEGLKKLIEAAQE